MEHLYESIVEADWAYSAPNQSYVSGPSWNFQQLYTALESAYSQTKKAKEAQLRDTEASFEEKKYPTIFSETQGFYGLSQNKELRSSKSLSDRSSNRIINYKSRVRCFNCKLQGYGVKGCRPFPKLTRNVHMMLEKDSNKIKMFFSSFTNSLNRTVLRISMTKRSDSTSNSEVDNEIPSTDDIVISTILTQDISSNQEDMYFKMG